MLPYYFDSLVLNFVKHPAFSFILRLIALFCVSLDCLAHMRIDTGVSLWYYWEYTPEITLPLLFTTVIYFRGLAKRREHQRPVATWQKILFLMGILSFVVGLQSPLEPLSDHFLFMHQIEHMLIRSVAPLLIILSMPLAPLIQGLPYPLRHYVLTPLLRNWLLQKLYLFLVHPWIASLVFIATLVIWQLPELHDRAVFDRGLHDSMHFSMILSGFFFWWLICDPRVKSARLSFGMRLLILWGVTVPNTIVGAMITLSHQQLYQAYDVLYGFWNIDKMLDQQLGGIIIWGPDGMMTFVGTGIVFLLWQRQEKLHKQQQSQIPSAP
jgi:putative membrane protein